MFSAAIRTRLLQSQVLINILPQWDFGTGGSTLPSIFDLDQAPDGAETPFILVNQVGGADNTEAESRGDDSIDIVVDINVWDEKLPSRQRSNRIAWEVFNILRRAASDGSVTVSGWTVLNIACGPPTRVGDSDGFPGEVIQTLIQAVRERS